MSQTPDEAPHGGGEPERPRWGQHATGQNAGRDAERDVPHGQSPSGGTPPAGAPYGRSPYGENPYGGSSSGENPYGESPYGKNPYGGSPYEASPAGGHSSGYGQASPYGQPPQGAAYGQGPAAAPGPPYGQAPGQPAQPMQPGHAGARPPAGKLTRPLTLVLAMVAMLAGGVSAVVLAFISYARFTSVDPGSLDGAFWEEFEAGTRESAELEGMSPEEAFSAAMLALGVLVVIAGFVLLALYITFAFVGTLTAVGRILATIFLAGSVTLVLFGLANLIVVALSAAAIVLLWLPASNAYFRERKARKTFGGPGGYPPQPYTSLPGQQPYGMTGEGGPPR